MGTPDAELLFKDNEPVYMNELKEELAGLTLSKPYVPGKRQEYPMEDDNKADGLLSPQFHSAFTSQHLSSKNKVE